VYYPQGLFTRQLIYETYSSPTKPDPTSKYVRCSPCSSSANPNTLFLPDSCPTSDHLISPVFQTLGGRSIC
jgi:hypothetical protein